MFDIENNEKYQFSKIIKAIKDKFEIIVMPYGREYFEYFGKIVKVDGKKTIVHNHIIILDGTVRKNEIGRIVGIIENIKHIKKLKNNINFL